MLDYLSKNWTNSFGVLCTFYFFFIEGRKKDSTYKQQISFRTSLLYKGCSCNTTVSESEFPHQIFRVCGNYECGTC